MDVVDTQTSAFPYACRVGRFTYVIREGKENEFDGPIIAENYRHGEAIDKPAKGDLVFVGDRQWRVVDYMRTDVFVSSGNILVVEAVDFGDLTTDDLS